MDDSNVQMEFPPAAMGHCRIQTALVSQSHGPASFDLGNYFRNTAKTVLLEAESPGQIISKPNCQQFLHKNWGLTLPTQLNINHRSSTLLQKSYTINYKHPWCMLLIAVTYHFEAKNSPISSHAKLPVKELCGLPLKVPPLVQRVPGEAPKKIPHKFPRINQSEGANWRTLKTTFDFCKFFEYQDGRCVFSGQISCRQLHWSSMKHPSVPLFPSSTHLWKSVRRTPKRGLHQEVWHPSKDFQEKKIWKTKW